MKIEVCWNNSFVSDDEYKKNITELLFNEFDLRNYNPGDLVTVERTDHSTAFEQFEVISRIYKRGELRYRVVYYGGGS